MEEVNTDLSKEKDTERKSGVAVIKAEYIIPDHKRTLSLECLSESDKEKLRSSEHDDKIENYNEGAGDASQPYKKQRLSNRERKKLRGQNKARPPPFRYVREKNLCRNLVDVRENEDLVTCSNEKCSFLHDIPAYLAAKPPDIGPTCYLYSTHGHCPRGVSCRFGSEHVTSSGRNKINQELYEKYLQSKGTINHLDKNLQISVRKRRYDFSRSEDVLKEYHTQKESRNSKNTNKRKEENAVGKDPGIEINGKKESVLQGADVDICKEKSENKSDDKPCGAVTDEDVIPIRNEEKKKLDWKGKLYLSPLTTVGNLPFRRICKEFGAEITCGEMAMANSLLQGNQQEWALVKRHESEDLFGVQLCGNNQYVMTRCAQMLEEKTEIDFIDVNLGCPIELVYEQGGGSGLLRREKALESVIRCMSTVLSLPLTVKTRTGVYTDKNIAHAFMPKFPKWGVSLVTVHGRSREQRYTKSADWEYIEKCARLGAPIPVFGNGDVLSFEDYEQALVNSPSVAGIMIGRGALIKPWIFTEVKERRHWDISSQERLDILKKYVNYGLEHWGSDTKGVENTRRFLLEWLSFLHRYIPVGLLEYPPQKMNQRPPYFRGRDDLETMMASSSCSDWLKISEMLLGPVPENYHFLPKHKANSWK